MRFTLIPMAFAAFAVANPLPQGLDWAAIDALDAIPTPTQPIVNAAAHASTVSYTPSAAASAVSASIAASGTSSADKRSIVERGIAPTSPDTDVAFLADTRYSSAAGSASTPSGYTQTFQNLNASSNAYGYMGYTVLNSYDSGLCGSKCDAIDGCASFNLCMLWIMVDILYSC